MPTWQLSLHNLRKLRPRKSNVSKRLMQLTESSRWPTGTVQAGLQQRGAGDKQPALLLLPALPRSLQHEGQGQIQAPRFPQIKNSHM